MEDNSNPLIKVISVIFGICVMTGVVGISMLWMMEYWGPRIGNKRAGEIFMFLILPVSALIGSFLAKWMVKKLFRVKL